MKSLITGILTLACATSAFAQDAILPAAETGLPLTLNATEPQPGASKDWALAILVEVLLPPGGDVASGVEWKDAFGEGVGLRLEFDRLWGLGAGDLKLGLYFGAGATFFGGEDIDIGGPDPLEMDPLIQAIVVVGAKLAYRPASGLQLEGRLGIGMVNYFNTEGEIGGLSFDVVDNSQEFFYELGGRIGFVAGSIVLEIGIQVRSQAEPEPADPSSLDFEDPLLIYGLDAGIMIRF
jgi:hypothetical protein